MANVHYCLTFDIFCSGSSSSGGAPSQLVATFMSEMLESGTVQDHIKHTLQPAYARRYRTMTIAVEDILVPLGVTLPHSNRAVVGGYFMWLSLPKPLMADEVAERAQAEENLVIGPGPLFGVYGDVQHAELERGVRLCFAWEEENTLREGIARLGRVISRMQNDGNANQRHNIRRGSYNGFS